MPWNKIQKSFSWSKLYQLALPLIFQYHGGSDHQSSKLLHFFRRRIYSFKTFVGDRSKLTGFYCFYNIFRWRAAMKRFLRMNDMAFMRDLRINFITVSLIVFSCKSMINKIQILLHGTRLCDDLFFSKLSYFNAGNN